MIGGGLHSELLRTDVEAAILDGFFPRVSRDAEPTRSRSGLQEFGLPYAADPAVTKTPPIMKPTQYMNWPNALCVLN